MERIKNSLFILIFLEIITRTLCDFLDLIPGENIWTFSSLSGSLGFWAISGMMVVMLYEKSWKSAIGTFLYFAFMNSSLFMVHFLISPLFLYPRILDLSEVLVQLAWWLIISVIYGLCALIAHLEKRNNMIGVIALSLPIELLISEAPSLLLFVFINHKYLFQTIIDVLGILVLWKLYSKEKNKLMVIVISFFIAGVLLGTSYILYETVLCY